MSERRAVLKVRLGRIIIVALTVETVVIVGLGVVLVVALAVLKREKDYYY